MILVLEINRGKTELEIKRKGMKLLVWANLPVAGLMGFCLGYLIDAPRKEKSR